MLKNKIKKGDRVVLENRGIKETGTVRKVVRRNDIQHFEILTDRGIVLERVTTNDTQPCYLNESLTFKYNNKKNEA
jgi:hypothetical protein